MPLRATKTETAQHIEYTLAPQVVDERDMTLGSQSTIRVEKNSTRLVLAYDVDPELLGRSWQQIVAELEAAVVIG